MYLERALDALRDGQPGYASAALHAALSTGELNDAGRALAYWYIYVADTMQGQAQSSHDALADFVAISDSVLATREHVRFAESGGTDFVDRFDLVGRLARGRALLNLAWAEGHAAFGRSADVPVPVRSEEELAYFVELTPACSHPLERKTSQMKTVGGNNASLRQVDFRCGNQMSDTTFFFEWRGQPSAEPAVASNATSAPLMPRKSVPAHKARKSAVKASTAR